MRKLGLPVDLLLHNLMFSFGILGIVHTLKQIKQTNLHQLINLPTILTILDRYLPINMHQQMIKQINDILRRWYSCGAKTKEFWEDWHVLTEETED